MSERVVVECSECGARLKLSDDSKLRKKIRCPKCSSVFDAEATEDFEDEAPRSRPAALAKRLTKKKGKKTSSGNAPALLIGGGVALLLLLGVGAWLLIGGGGPAGNGPAMNAPANLGGAADAPGLAQPPAGKPVVVSNVELEPRTVLNGRLTLLVPKAFGEMSDEMRAAKYPAANRPPLVFTNEDGTVSVAINHTPNRMTKADLPKFASQMEGAFRQQATPDGWIGAQTVSINGLDWHKLEVRIQAADMVLRNWIVFTNVENRMLALNITVPQSNEGAWEPAVNSMISSLKIGPPTGISKPNVDVETLFSDGSTNLDATPVKPLPAAALGNGQATIRISNLKDTKQGSEFTNQIRRLTQSRSSSSSVKDHDVAITIDSAGDLKLLASALELGEVTEVNEETRTISIRANP